jgi:hypothetical protein
MFQSIRKHLSYSNVAATLALVFALTGGAFAATSHSGGRGGLSWPRRGGLKWPHFASVVVCVDLL